jgi:hypothetical protein
MLPSIDYHIKNAELTLRRLSLERQIAAVKKSRETAAIVHEKVCRHYTDRLAAASKRLRSTIECPHLKDYIEAVGQQYDSIPLQYVVRKHAEIVRFMRVQEVMDLYLQLEERQYENMIGELEDIKENVLDELNILRTQHYEQECRIQDQRIHILTEKVKSYYLEKRTTVTSKSELLHHVVLKKASARVWSV